MAPKQTPRKRPAAAEVGRRSATRPCVWDEKRERERDDESEREREREREGDAKCTAACARLDHVLAHTLA